MPNWLIALLASTLVFCPTQAFAQAEDPYEALRAQDMRLAAIADRVLVANVHLCRRTMPATGMLLHSADQYSAAQPQWFSNGPIAIAAIQPGSAADRAGVAANDGLSQVDGAMLDTLTGEEGAPQRDAAFGQIAASAADMPLRLTIQRGEETLQFMIDAPQACRALVEVLTTNDRIARSDGRVVQISYGLADRLTEGQLATVFAHELAHSVLEHRRRLEEADVDGGFFGEFGRSGRLNRIVEIEADRLSVHLLANAGFDPAIGPAFWRSEEGRRAGGGILRSRVYPSRERRAENLEEEVAAYLRDRPAPSYAVHLIALRDQAFPED